MTHIRLLLILYIISIIVLSCQPGEMPKGQDIIVFSKTTEFRHKSIAAGKEALRKIAERNHWKVTFSENARIFNPESLEGVKVVVFLNTTGNILNATQEQHFEEFIQNGGGFVGIHSATVTEPNWAWYRKLVGTYFKNYMNIQKATINIIDPNHPCTQHLDQTWEHTDEWYNFIDPLDEKQYHILAELDESSYQGGGKGEKHPISWCHEYDGGKVFYTALGHTKESYQEKEFLCHIEQGIRWTMEE